MSENHQQKLIELVVDKVLKKHGVLDEKQKLDPEEKQKIAEVVQNIKTDVESFLENAKVAKTEKDFPDNVTEEVEEKVVKRKPVFKSNNDVKAVKKFF